MLKLLIDSQEVRLSEDLQTDYFITNPYFTRTGEHTYDIDIDLSDPVNAAIYGHIDRADVGTRYHHRSALLISEHGVLMRGTEVILQLEDGHAKIQLVAGNSEMNYLAGDSLYLDMLDLGEIETLTSSVATQSLSGTYPEWDFVCCPICTYNEEETADYEFIADASSRFMVGSVPVSTNVMPEKRALATVFVSYSILTPRASSASTSALKSGCENASATDSAMISPKPSIAAISSDFA